MPIYKNPITIVQGAPSAEPLISYAESSVPAAIQTASGDWYYPSAQYSHGVLRENAANNLYVQLNDANSFRVVVKARLKMLQNKTVLFFSIGDQLVYISASNIFSCDAAGLGIFTAVHGEINKWFYICLSYFNRGTVIASCYDEQGMLLGLGTRSVGKIQNTSSLPLTIGGSINNSAWTGTKVEIDINEVVFEKNGSILWGKTNSKTQNMGVFRFDDWNDFTEVEYIEATGTQYIDTQYTPIISDDISISVYPVDDGAFWGCTNFTTARAGVDFFRIFNTSGVSSGTLPLNQWQNGVYDGTNKVFTMHGNSVSAGSSSASGSFWLFGRSDTQATGSSRIKSFVVGGKLNLKPCYHTATGIIGMFDTVNNKFYTNAGTGEFIKGADV